MTLNKFILKKICFSSFISLLISYSFFFIFSLLGNLGEKYSFYVILFSSLISAFQIMFYIPIFLFFFILVIFFISLKTHNELVIIFHYFSIKKVFFTFSILILIFTSLELNKNYFIKKLEFIKNEYYDYSQNFNLKLLVRSDQNKNTYFLLKRNTENKTLSNLSSFEIDNKKNYQALYTNKLLIENDKLFTNEYILLTNNNIKEINDKKNLLIGISHILNDKEMINYLNNQIQYLSLDTIKKIIFIFSILTLVFFIFLKKKYLQKSKNQSFKYLIIVIIIFYAYLMLNFKLIFFQNIFEFLGILFIATLIYQNIKHNE